MFFQYAIFGVYMTLYPLYLFALSRVTREFQQQSLQVEQEAHRLFLIRMRYICEVAVACQR